MKKTIYRLFLLTMTLVLTFGFTACSFNKEGRDGANGKSAYQIWLDEGHSGSEADFLIWLKGAAGLDGVNGKNGRDGANGESAYQIWLDEGHSGSKADFLIWLKGAAGLDGLSAYEIYKRNNPDYIGSERQWIDDFANGRLAKYTVTFVSNGGTAVSPIVNKLKGDKINEPIAPYKTDYVFAGWFKERELLSKWNFDIDTVLSDTVLYAKWNESKEILLFTPIQGETNCSVELNFVDPDSDIMINVIIPPTAVIKGTEYTVTQIAHLGFSHCNNLKTVIFPPTVTKIDSFAFMNCKNLRTVYMPRVEAVASMAFAYCPRLENIFLPSSLSSVEKNIFGHSDIDRNYPLNIYFEGSEKDSAEWIQHLGISEDNVNITYDSSYTSAENLVFTPLGTNECGVEISGDARATLKTLYLPPVFNGRLLTQIASSGFADCPNLREVVLPATVRILNAAAFYNCANLEKIDLSDAEYIGANAFALASKLKELIIPLSVERLGEGILAISGQVRESNLNVYIDAEYDTVLMSLWSGWQKNSGKNISVFYGWLTPATLTFETNGGSEISSLNIRKGRKLDGSPTPYKDNFTFAGWFKDEELTKPWDYDKDVVTESITLYASWTEGEAATAGLSFTLINNNEYKVSKGSADLTGRLVIPAKFNEKPVTAIDVRAFANISNLGLTSQISSVNIPDTIIDLGTQSFYGCTRLTTVTIPSGVAEIGSAFDNCSGLTTIKVSENNNSLYAESNCIIRTSDKVLTFGCRSSSIPDCIKGIGDYAFAGCAGLTSISIPFGVQFIGKSAFSQCYNLRMVIIPDSVQAIGDMAFFNCIRLTNINIPYGIKEIADNAFDSCYWLRSIIIPGSVERLGNFAFADTALSSVIIPYGVKSLGDFAFYNCENLKSIIIPDSVTTLDSNAFVKCVALESLTLSKNLEEISINSFGHCSALKNLILPQGLKIIHGSTFVDCTSLQSIVIPGSVTYIGNSAFSGCQALKTIYYGGINQSE